MPNTNQSLQLTPNDVVVGFSNSVLFKDSQGNGFKVRAGWQNDSQATTTPSYNQFKSLQSMKKFDGMTEEDFYSATGELETSIKKAKAGLLIIFGDRDTNSIVFADFDKEAICYSPDGNHIYNNHEDLRSVLREEFQGIATVIPTSRKRTKLAFIVSGQLDASERISFLSQMLPAHYFRGIDTTDAALRWTFIKEDAASILCDELPTLPIHEYVRPTAVQPTPAVPKQQVKLYTQSIDSYTALLTAKGIKLNRVKEHIMRMVFGYSKRSISLLGLDLPSTFIASQCGCSRNYVTMMLKELIRDGQLKSLRESWKPGCYGKAYRTAGEATEFATSILQSINTYHRNRAAGIKAASEFKTPKPETVVIEPGTSNDRIFKLTYYFTNEIDYLSFMSRVPAVVERPELLNEAKRAWRHRLNWILKQLKKVA